MNFRYGPGGSLTVDRIIKDITQTLTDDETIKYYGYKHFIAESMNKATAMHLANTLTKVGMAMVEEWNI